MAKNGARDATKNPAIIEEWFRDSRLGIGIGIATGAVSGLVALDIDPRHEGDETLAALERQHGPLPHTWRFLTGGGGEHILLRHPGGSVPNSVGRLGPGIDVRGDGGYLVAPPSRHISGRPYAIDVDHHPDEVPLAGAPGWLILLLRGRVATEQARAKPASDWRDLVRKPVKEGQRNQTLARLAGHLLRNRIDPWVALELLRAWNNTRCDPPLDDGEVLGTVCSIARREIERREGRDG